MTSVVFIPGSSFAAHSFRDLAPLLPGDWSRVFHDMPGSTHKEVPVSFTWMDELDVLADEIDTLAGEVYIIGLSAGATLALAYVDRFPDRVSGLALIEPAWIFAELTGRQAAYYEELDTVLQLPPSQQAGAFRRLVVGDENLVPAVKPEWDKPYEYAANSGVTPLAIMTKAMLAHPVHENYLSLYTGPVYLAVGGLSNPMWEDQASVFQSLHPHTVLDVYPERHHLDAPHHKQADQFADRALDTWGLSEK